MWSEGVGAVRRRVGCAPGGVGWPMKWREKSAGSLSREPSLRRLRARRPADPRLDVDTTVWASTDAEFGDLGNQKGKL